MRVLIIDDDFGVLTLARKELTNAGHVVHVASDVSTGIERAYTYEPTAIALDIHLPDGSGVEAVSYLLGVAPLAAMVMMTTDLDWGLRDASFSRGAHAFCPKSDLHALPGVLDYVTSALRRRRR